jgi:hypothetical protein
MYFQFVFKTLFYENVHDGKIIHIIIFGGKLGGPIIHFCWWEQGGE